MYISKKWLGNYVELPKELDSQELAEKITTSIVEIDNFFDQEKELENIIVAKIIEINNHPNADKLKICQVDSGNRGMLKIVCGGNNLKKGMIVALALPGAKVRWHGEGEPVILEKAKIRGVESDGMICAAEEIGLADSYSVEGGIADLNLDDSYIGKNIATALHLDDVIFEIDNKSLTNRPDLWGHYGIARELSALLDLRFKKLKFLEKFRKTKGDEFSIEILDKESCPRYLGVLIENIEVSGSPQWIRAYLEKSGIRSINNIVDITNFVMLELGQPLHAFDAKNLDDNKIIVRKANKGEKFKTLDREERILTQEDLLICDAKKPVALAGIMGGENSEITDSTKSIFIESANFKASSIRKTSMRLGLRTDASARFEKSLDPELARCAIFRAIELVEQLCVKSKVVNEIIDSDFSSKEKIIINLNIKFLNDRIGCEIAVDKIISILNNLGFIIKNKKTYLEVTVPSHRATGDIKIPEDLVEEIARIYGYKNIVVKEPIISLKPVYRDKSIQLERNIKNFISKDLGYCEIYNYSMISEDEINFVNGKTDNYIEIANAVSKNLKYLRNSLNISLLKNVSSNLRFYKEFKIFEIGRIFRKENGEFRANKNSKEFLPMQDKFLGFAISGRDKFFELKGDIESAFSYLKVDFKEVPCNNDLFENNKCLEYHSSGELIACFGEIKKQILNNFDIDKSDVLFGEVNFSKLCKYSKDKREYRELPKFPKMTQDISMLLDYSSNWKDIEKRIKSTSALIEGVELFDIYEGEKIGKGLRSIAFHVTFYDSTKTLVSEEIEKIMSEIRRILVTEFKAKIR
ncbi:MAG: phenylalanine--tRNA ligase subunit beta [Patescibacteria group bacterium]|nr:phenylalanine--tRNA ligase subunit beta [Patescibacteria group bacterium]